MDLDQGKEDGEDQASNQGDHGCSVVESYLVQSDDQNQEADVVVAYTPIVHEVGVGVFSPSNLPA